MKILLLSHQPLDSGGDMARARALGRELARAGNQVVVYGDAPRRATAGEGIELLHDPRYRPARMRSRGLHPAAWVRRRRVLSQRSFDIVHSFGVRPAVVLPSIWLQRAGVTWLADWSDYWGWPGIASQRSLSARLTIGVLDTLLERFSRRRADGLTVASRYLDRLAEEYGVPPARRHYLGGGADVRAIQAMDRNAARQELGVLQDVPIVVFSGDSEFDLKIVGETFSELRRLLPEVQLHLLGSQRSQGAELAVSEGVVAWGFLPLEKMAEVIACADVALLPLPDHPFNLARFPNRLGDYLAAGRPVVTNPTGDAGRLVAEERVGLVVPGQPGAMAQALSHLLAHPGKARELGLRARQVAEERMAWQQLVGKLTNFYVRSVPSH